jgi:hypothetical protein
MGGGSRRPWGWVKIGYSRVVHYDVPAVDDGEEDGAGKLHVSLEERNHFCPSARRGDHEHILRIQARRQKIQRKI